MLHKFEAEYREHKQTHGNGDHGLAPGDAPLDDVAKMGVEIISQRSDASNAGQAREPVRPGFRFFMPVPVVLRQQVIAQIRNHDHRRHPRDQQREHHHLKNRQRVFTGAGLGRGNRQKAGRRHQGAGQHRERGRGVGEACRLETVHPLFHFHRHHLDRDDGVIDQQPERKYQRAERNLVQADIEHLHEHEGQRQHQRDRQRDHNAGAHAERQKAHCQHDDHGFRHRTHKVAD